MKRTLSLKRETLADLTTAELAALAGAGPTTTGPQPTPPVYVLTHECTRTNIICLPTYLTQGESCDYC